MTTRDDEAAGLDHGSAEGAPSRPWESPVRDGYTEFHAGPECERCGRRAPWHPDASCHVFHPKAAHGPAIEALCVIGSLVENAGDFGLALAPELRQLIQERVRAVVPQATRMAYVQSRRA